MATLDDAGQEVEPGDLVALWPDRLDREIAVLAQ